MLGEWSGGRITDRLKVLGGSCSCFQQAVLCQKQEALKEIAGGNFCAVCVRPKRKRPGRGKCLKRFKEEKQDGGIYTGGRERENGTNDVKEKSPQQENGSKKKEVKGESGSRGELGRGGAKVAKTWRGCES